MYTMDYEKIIDFLESEKFKEKSDRYISRRARMYPIVNKKGRSLKQLKNIASGLREAQTSGLKPLPAFSDLIPHMAISLRDLELLNLAANRVSATSPGGNVFERVASIDSPYREQIMWAYLQVAGRPGLPERDIKSWIKSILDQFLSITEPEDD